MAEAGAPEPGPLGLSHARSQEAGLGRLWEGAAPAGPLVAQTVKNPPAVQRPVLDLRVRKIPQRRKCLHTPVFLPGEFHGQKSLEDYSPQGRRRIGCNWQLRLPAPSTSPQGSGLLTGGPMAPGHGEEGQGQIRVSAQFSRSVVSNFL